jgi:hypothetical protein
MLYLETTWVALEEDWLEGMKCTFSEIFSSFVICNERTELVV